MRSRTPFVALSLVLSLSLAGALVPHVSHAQPRETPQTPAEARKLSDAFVQVADKVSPSVVQIDVTAKDEPDPVLKLFG
ncbi:MAG: hypothetical protein JNM74_16725, partial [Myxococcales bacterium]|nr:hypothetical protein [Myxococcales bacterium]